MFVFFVALVPPGHRRLGAEIAPEIRPRFGGVSGNRLEGPAEMPAGANVGMQIEKR